MQSVLGYYRLGQAYPRLRLRAEYPRPIRVRIVEYPEPPPACDGGRADALRWKIASTEIKHLEAIGAIPGLVVLNVAARNAPGKGRLRSENAGTKIRWRAPGSGTFGPAVDCGTDGAYLLEDGDDHNKWIRVQVYSSYLGPAATEEDVWLDDLYANGPPHDDVTAAEASAGDVETYQLKMVNESPAALHAIIVWLDPATSYLEISDDNASWVSPTSEATGLQFGTLTAGQQKTLYLRRTIPASTSSDPDMLTHLEYCFDSPA